MEEIRAGREIKGRVSVDKVRGREHIRHTHSIPYREQRKSGRVRETRNRQ